MLWHGFGNLMTGLYRREHLMKTSLFVSVRRDYWDSVDLVFLFDLALHGDIIWTDDVLLHKREGGVSGQMIDRSLPETILAFGATWILYERRVWQSDLPLLSKVYLAASVLLRMPCVLWETRLYYAYALLVAIDRRGMLRKWLREHFLRDFVRRLEARG